jgi:hypothetical protein
MTEQEWLECTVPAQILRFLRVGGSNTLRPLIIEGLSAVLTQTLKRIATQRKLRLFICACYRRLWARFPDPEADWNLLLVCERYADGSITKAEFKFARKRAIDRWAPMAVGDRLEAASMSSANCLSVVESYVLGDEPESPKGNAILLEESVVQCDILRDLFGNPFRPVSGVPSWLAWHDGTVPKIAQAIYDERRFTDLPILADALEEAGCTNADILGHCRSEGPHVRGCWVVDLILGKQ